MTTQHTIQDIAPTVGQDADQLHVLPEARRLAVEEGGQPATIHTKEETDEECADLGEQLDKMKETMSAMRKIK